MFLNVERKVCCHGNQLIGNFLIFNVLKLEFWVDIVTCIKRESYWHEICPAKTENNNNNTTKSGIRKKFYVNFMWKAQRHLENVLFLPADNFSIAISVSKSQPSVD